MNARRTSEQEPTERPDARSRRRLRRLGLVLIVAGGLVITWSLVVWRANDPVTSIYTHWQQARLSREYARVTEHHLATVAPRRSGRAEAEQAVERAARAFGSSAGEGDPIGRIIVPGLALDAVLVNGTATSSLRKGPGRDLRTFFPGEGQLVYIAGHRTTFAAPFSRIDRLAAGDRVTLEMPYGTFVYVVTGHSIVDANDLSVLTSHGHEVVALQACHPRFFASHRYIVWARPLSFAPHGGRTYTDPGAP
jgi:sortase A